MSLLFRARLSSFLAGVALAGVAGVYQLRADVSEGQENVVKQVKTYCTTLEQRIAALEAQQQVSKQ
jgi:hypothetical protein